ncbi:MAG: Sua5 family C-terminal domain-containing protein, partial [Brachymonas sp.]
TKAQIEAALGRELLSNDEHVAQILRRQNAKNASGLPAAPRASGMLESHYAPRAPLRLMDAQALQTALNVLGAEAKHIAVYARSALKIASNSLIVRRMPDDALATAQQLFAVLREFDASEVKLIWVENVPSDSAWDGVRDRLQRASN